MLAVVVFLRPLIKLYGTLVMMKKSSTIKVQKTLAHTFLQPLSQKVTPASEVVLRKIVDKILKLQ
jgi:hypothetical protein